MYYDQFDVKSKFGEVALQMLESEAFSKSRLYATNYVVEGKRQDTEGRQIVICMKGRSFAITEFRVLGSHRSFFAITEF
jgi:hypothetical protein